MNKEKFLRYFKKKENTEDNEDITITNVVTSVTKDITYVELSFAVDEIKEITQATYPVSEANSARKLEKRSWEACVNIWNFSCY